jgi:hypothetical protein
MQEVEAACVFSEHTRDVAARRIFDGLSDIRLEPDASRTGKSFRIPTLRGRILLKASGH